MHRRFCARCGTPLFSEAEPRPHQIIVRAGTLDDPGLAKPVAIIWTKSAPYVGLFRSEPAAGGGTSAPPTEELTLQLEDAAPALG